MSQRALTGLCRTRLIGGSIRSFGLFASLDLRLGIWLLCIRDAGKLQAECRTTEQVFCWLHGNNDRSCTCRKVCTAVEELLPFLAANATAPCGTNRDTMQCLSLLVDVVLSPCSTKIFIAQLLAGRAQCEGESMTERLDSASFAALLTCKCTSRPLFWQPMARLSYVMHMNNFNLFVSRIFWFIENSYWWWKQTLLKGFDSYEVFFFLI